MDQGNRLFRIMNELERMPGAEILKSLQGFNISIFIFDKNYGDLEKFIKLATDDQQSGHLYWLRNKDQLQNAMFHIIRLTHNFVASSLSLIDHTRRLYLKLYKENGLFPEYDPKVQSEFAKDPLAQFVKGLRQYCQHYKAPDLSIETAVSGPEADPTRTVYLLKEDLAAFERWNSPALRYLDGIDDQVNILEVAKEYREKVLDFYNWFQHRQREIHHDELEEFWGKQNEYACLLLDLKINSSIGSFGQDIPHERDEIFLSIFSSEEFKKLEKLPIDSSERAELSIQLLKQHIAITDDFAEKIRHWYREVGSKL